METVRRIKISGTELCGEGYQEEGNIGVIGRRGDERRRTVGRWEGVKVLGLSLQIPSELQNSRQDIAPESVTRNQRVRRDFRTETSPCRSRGIGLTETRGVLEGELRSELHTTRTPT